jgi:hypothetical protein
MPYKNTNCKIKLYYYILIFKIKFYIFTKWKNISQYITSNFFQNMIIFIDILEIYHLYNYDKIISRNIKINNFL